MFIIQLQPVIHMDFTKKGYLRVLLAVAIIYFMGSCSNDPINPNDSSDADSIFSQNPFDSLNINDNRHNTDSAFNNSNGKIINAVCYGPFRDGQGPGSSLSYSQIKEDLLIMEKHWDAFRLYTTDKNAQKILKVISEDSIDIKVMLGVWISLGARLENGVQVEKAISLANAYPDIVQAISCGNEIFGLSDSGIDVRDKNEIIGYLNEMKKRTPVPLTINDLYYVWTNDYYSDVVSALDFLTIHFYGQWFNIELDKTVSSLRDVVHNLWKKYPEKEIVVGEIGWATSKNLGQFNPIADEKSQKVFYETCQAWSESNKVTVFYFEAFNERWKGDTDTEAETNWGFYYADRTPKLVFQAGD